MELLADVLPRCNVEDTRSRRLARVDRCVGVELSGKGGNGARHLYDWNGQREQMAGARDDKSSALHGRLSGGLVDVWDVPAYLDKRWRRLWEDNG